MSKMQDLDAAIDLLYKAKRTLAAQDEDSAYPGSRRDFPIAPVVAEIQEFLGEAAPRQGARKRKRAS